MTANDFKALNNNPCIHSNIYTHFKKINRKNRKKSVCIPILQISITPTPKLVIKEKVMTMPFLGNCT